MFGGKPKWPYGTVVAHSRLYRHLGAVIDPTIPKDGSYYQWWRWQSNNESFHILQQFPYATSSTTWMTSYGGTIDATYGPCYMMMTSGNPTPWEATPLYGVPSWSLHYPMAITCGANSKNNIFQRP